MNWGLLVYALTLEGLGVALYPLLEQSAVQANSLFGWYLSLVILFSFMMGGVTLTILGLVMRRPVSQGQVKGVVGMSSILALVFSIGVLWSEAIYSDTLAACPEVSGTGLFSCELLPGRSLLPAVYGIGLATCVLILAGSARMMFSLKRESIEASAPCELP